jgi:hypothetical protein
MPLNVYADRSALAISCTFDFEAELFLEEITTGASATRQLIVPWYILQVTFWDIHHAGSAAILAVPCPTTHFLVIQRPPKHLHHVLSNVGHKLPTVKGAARCNVEPIALWMRADDEVLVRCHGVPRLRSASIIWRLVEVG